MKKEEKEEYHIKSVTESGRKLRDYWLAGGEKGLKKTERRPKQNIQEKEKIF